LASPPKSSWSAQFRATGLAQKKPNLNWRRCPSGFCQPRWPLMAMWPAESV